VTVWIFSLLSVAAVSLVSLVGLATLSLNEAQLRRAATTLVSFAVGALLGDAFIHLIPETFAASDTTALVPSLLILAGMLVFFVVEKLLRHQHGPLHHQHHPGTRVPELAAINVVGDAVHNFIDGILIGASYLASPALVISTTLAVMLHEIPQELADFGVLVHSGLPVRKAVWFNVLSASAAILGTVAILTVGTTAGRAVTHLLVPFTAGAFVYIASADLIPELQHDRSLRSLLVQAPLVMLGVCVMALIAVVG
jgi:zinc and cadmium transporter